MGHYIVGALGYADDLILLSPIVYGLEGGGGERERERG